MTIGLATRQRKTPKRFWGGSRIREEYRPLPRSLRYNVEALEPRYLLTGVALTNATNDGSQATDAAYVTAVSNAVQTVIIGQSGANQTIIGGLSYLGKQTTASSLTDPTATTKIPLLNQTPNQLASLTTVGSSFGTQGGNITLGSLLLDETDSSGNNLFSQAVKSAIKASNNPTTTDLANDLQTVGQQLFGSAFTVTDLSSGTTLDLQVSFLADTVHSVPIDIGAAAGEYNILLQSEATGDPNVQLETKLSATYDITANLTAFNTEYKGANSTTVEAGTFNLVTTPSSFQQSAEALTTPTAGIPPGEVYTPLQTFGLEFGVIGAGSPGIIENSAKITNNSFTLTVGDTSDLSIGMSVSGGNIAAGTTITAVNSGSVTLSNKATATATESVTIGAVNGAFVNQSALVEGSVVVTNGSNTLHFDSVANMTAAMAVQGNGIAVGTTIASIDTTTNIVTLSKAAIGSSGSAGTTVTVGATAGVVLDEQMNLQLQSSLLSYANIKTSTFSFLAPLALTSSTAVQLSDFKTQTQFGVEVDNGSSSTYGPGFTTVTLAGSGASTYTQAGLITALNAALKTAGLNNGLGNGVMVRSIPLTGGSGFGLQFFGGADAAQISIVDNTAASGNSAIAKFNLATVPLTSGAAVQLTDFSTQTKFAIDVDDGTNATYGAGYVTVTLAGSGTYTQATLVTALNAALKTAGLNDGLGNGVMVRAVALPSGPGFALQFFGGKNVSQIFVADSTAAPGALAKFQLSINSLDSTVIGRKGDPNTAQLGTGSMGFEDNSALSGFISGLNLNGIFTFYSNNVFDGHPLLVYPSSTALADLARITNADIVVDAQDADSLISELNASNPLGANVPFSSETLSDAYDFGTAAQLGFVNALQNTTMVLIGTNSPGTYTSGVLDQTDLSGSASFTLQMAVGTGAATSYTINVASGAKNRSLQAVADAVNVGLNNQGLSSSFTAVVNGTVLELVSAVSGIQYFLSNFNSDVASPGNGVLNLGFNSYSSVAAYANTNPNQVIDTSNPATKYQIPGVTLTSGTAVDLTAFQTATQFGIQVNNGTNTAYGISGTTYGSGYITVSLAAGSYTQASLVSALTTALQQAMLNDGFTTNGVSVRALAVGSGFGIQFYGGDDVYKLSIANVGTGTDVSKFNLSSTTSTAPTISISENGAAAVTYYLNGNFTTGLLDNLGVPTTVNDLVYDLQQALVSSGALSADETTGITVSSTPSGTGDMLVFAAANPGSGAGQIAKFTITAVSSGLSSLNIQPSAASMHWAVAQSQSQPSFVTIEQLEALLVQKGILATGKVGSFLSTTQTFSFPLDFTVASGTTDFPDLSVPLSFATAYGSVSDLQSSTNVTLSRSDNISFTFGFNVTPPGTSTEVLNADLPIAVPLWDNLTYQALPTTEPLIFQISTDDGVLHTVELDQVVQTDGTSKFYPSTEGNGTSYDFITALNRALIDTGFFTGSGSNKTATVTAAFSAEDSYGRTTLVFSTTAGAYRELVVTVPPESSNVFSVGDSAWNNLGFSSSSGTTLTATSNSNTAHNTNNQISASQPLFYTVVNSNNTIPTDGNFYVTLPDGTNSAFTFNPANLPASASTADILNEFNLEIGSVTELLGSSFGALSNATVAMNLVSGNTTATLNSVVDPTPYLIGTTNNIGSGYGLTLGMALTGAGIAAGTTIQSLTYDSASKTVSVGLSAAATTTTGTGGVAVTVQSAANSGVLNAIPKLIPIAVVNGANVTIVLTLNPQVFGPSLQTWTLNTASTYLQQYDNPASLALEMPGITYADSSVEATGIVSAVISPDTFTTANWPTNTPASFQVSINGSSYVNVSMSKAALGGNLTIAGLISALNASLAATSINLGVPGAPNATSYNLGQFLQAEATNGGTEVIMRVLNTSTGSNPVSVTDARFALTSGANVMGGVLGFFGSSTSPEYLFGQRGSEAIVTAPVLTGTLTINKQAFVGTGQFGFVDFNVGAGEIDETIDVSLTDHSSTILDLNQAIIDANDAASTLYKAYVLVIQADNTAEVKLDTLSFPNSSGISGLTFNIGGSNNAEIVIQYTTTGATSITDFYNLPANPSIVYTKTNGMELLARLTFADIANGLMRVGDMLSDWMNTDLQDPFSSTLLYTKDSLVQIEDFGADFKAAIESIASSAPVSLQAAAQALNTGLQLLSLGGVGVIFSLLNTSAVGGGQLALQMSLGWVKAVTKKETLSVDLATMYAEASAANGGSSGFTPSKDLLDLSSISVNNVDVLLTEVASLNLNMTFVVAASADGVAKPTAIQTETEINQPSGNFFETRFFLEQDGITGRLPAGADYLQLTNGSVVIDATGQSDIPFSGQTADGTLILTNSTGNNTSSLVSGTVPYDPTTKIVNGQTVNADTGTLVQGITTLPFNAPVINGTISGSGIFTVGGVTPAVNSQVLVDTANDYTILANAQYDAVNTAQNYVLSGISASILNHLTVGQGISGSFIPEGTVISSINVAGGSLQLSQPFSGFESQTGGIFFIHQLPIMTANTSITAPNTNILSGISAAVFQQLAVGMIVTGSLLPSGTTILSIDAADGQITLSNAATAAQTGATFFLQAPVSAANGLYTVTQNGSGGFVLTLAQSANAISASTTPDVRFVMTSAGASVTANQVFQLSSIDQFIAVTTAPTNTDAFGTAFVYDINAASTFVAPTITPVLAASTTNFSSGVATQTGGLWTFKDTNTTHTSITIDSTTLNKALETSQGSTQVILNHQADASQNGLYTLTLTTGGGWTLVQTSTPAQLSSATRYHILKGTIYGGVLLGTYGGTAFSVMLQPASYTYNLQTINGSKTEILPYTVDAATDAPLTGTATVAAVASYTGGVITSLTKINLNEQQFASSAGNALVTGIDGVSTLTVGSLVLVKDEVGNSTAYENGIYVVTSLGEDGVSNWVLTRADFASTPAEVTNIRVAVDQGFTNANTRWVETASVTGTLFSAGVAVTFSNKLGIVYEDSATQTPWIVSGAVGASSANLPLQLMQVNDDGSTSTIDRDLIGISSDAKTALGGAGSTLTEDPLYLYTQTKVGSNWVIGQTPIFSSLRIVVPNLENFYTAKDPTGTLFFNPAAGADLTNTNTPNNPPALVDSATSSSVLTQLQNGFYLGDALDLALFAIQSAVDEALGIEFPLVGTNLNLYTSYVEQIRSTLTNNIRNYILANPLTPVDDIRNAMFATLGDNPGGLGYIFDENQIKVNLYTGSTKSSFDFNSGDLANYVQTPLGLKNIVSPGVTAITFSIQLLGTKGGAGYSDTKLDQVTLGDSTIGEVIDTNTVSPTGAATKGGVDVQTWFDFNFGFGVSTSTGFFIFNPTSSSTTTSNLVNIQFQAQLTGDVTSIAPTAFVQKNFNSTLQNLQINVADGRALTDSTGDGGDGFTSFFMGDATFDLNNHITTNFGTDPLGRTTGSGIFATVDDIRVAQELGPNVTAHALKPSALINFNINADADIDLLIQSKQAGLIPAIEADLIVAKEYGAGAIGTFSTIKFQNSALIGLGDQSTGSKVLTDFNTYYDPNTADNNTTAYNGLTSDQKDAIDTLFKDASPTWRFERGELVANGQAGKTFVAFQNLKIDVYDYLAGPFFKSLINLENLIAPERPVLDFLTTPVPGTQWMGGGGLTLINIFPTNLSPKNQAAPPGKPTQGKAAVPMSYAARIILVVQLLHAIDNMLGPLAELAASASSTDPFQHPQADLGGTGGFSNKPIMLNGLTDKQNIDNLNLYKAAQAKATSSRSTEQSTEQGSSSTSDAVANQNAIQKVLGSLSDALLTPNKYSQTFSSLQDGTYFNSGAESSLVEKSKGALNEGAIKNDKRGGMTSINLGISGGAFFLDAFSPNSIIEVLNGETADLLRVQFPIFSATFAYLRTFPLPAFPPLQLRLGIGVTISVDVNFGFDTNGFYWNEFDPVTGALAPFFSIAIKFSIGVGLDLGPVSVSIDVFFTLTVGFVWNDISGTGRLHQSDIDYLLSHGQSPVAVELKGTFGFHFEIDITIPLIFTSITIPIYQYDFSLTVFDKVYGAYTASIQLGSAAGGVLLLDMGPYAANRNYVNVSNRNEVFYVYDFGGANGSGESVLVEFDTGSAVYYQTFSGIKQVVGYAGVGDSAIYAGTTTTLSADIFTVDGQKINSGTVLGALTAAVVDFYGGAGNVILQAGASYSSTFAGTFGRSRLVGGTGTSYLDGSVSHSSLDLIAGVTTSTIQGSLAGHDNIVARQGSDLLYGNGSNDTFTFTTGFGHDRIYATGNGNTVNFDGLSLSAEGSHVAPLSIAAITTPITFQFGQLVDSAVTANSTVFFAVDPSEGNSIDTWIGGTGGDTFTVFFFASNQTLNLNEAVNSGLNQYDIFLGDPNIHYYLPGDPRNTGTININDASAIQGQVFLTQLYSNTITYNGTMVSNGREQMTFNPSLAVSLDAPDSTLYWGNASNPSAYTLQSGGQINIGHLVLLGNVLLTSNTIIHTSHSFTLDYDIDIAGGTLANPASIEFDLRSTNPNIDANFVLANNSADATPTMSRLMISTVNGTTKVVSTDGLGIGNIFLNLYTGSLLNQSGTTNDGIIEIGTGGTLVVLALETIGTLTSPINLKVDNFTAKTTSLLNPLASFGIYVYSTANLNLTGYGSVSGNQDDNLIGLSTVNGNIKVELAPNLDLTYYQIVAGSGGNIEFIADNISAAKPFTVVLNELEYIPQSFTFGFVFYVPVYETFTINFVFFNYTYTELVYIPEYFSYTYTYYIPEILPETVTVDVSTSKLQGTGKLTLENATAGENIQVGGTALLPAATGLLISDDLLSRITTGFASLTIGRPKPTNGSLSTGAITLAKAESFTENTTLQGTQLNIGFSLTSTTSLDLIAYASTAGTTALNFSTGKTDIYQAGTVIVSSDQTSDLNLHGLFLSTLAGGSIQVTTGGNLNVFGSLVANMGNASQVKIIAGNSILFQNTDLIGTYDSISADGTSDTTSIISLMAGTANVNSGGISQIEPTTSGQTTRSFLVAPIMTMTAIGSIVLSAEMDSLLLASASSVNLTNTNLSATLWSVGKVTATSGGITLEDDLSGIQLARTSTYAALDLISTSAANQSVTITTGGSFTGDSGGTLFGGVNDISTHSLTLQTATSIAGAGGSVSSNLAIQAALLSANVTGTGDILIDNFNSAITLTSLKTHNGLIAFQSNKDVTVGTVQSATTSVGNTINLTTSLGANINLGSRTAPFNGIIDAGNLGTVTLFSAGLIQGALSGNQTDITTQSLDTITGAIVSLTANGNAGSTGNAIIAAVKTHYLDAISTGTGMIQIYALSPTKTGTETSEDIFLHDIDSSLGNIVILGQAAGGSVLPLNFVTGDLNSRANNLTLKTSGTITQQTAPLTAQDVQDHLSFQLAGDLLTTLSTGTSLLNTSIVDLDARVLGTGTLTVDENPLLTLDVFRATTVNGDITINSGSVRVGTINAGMTGGTGTKSNVLINVPTGDILDLSSQENNNSAEFATILAQVGGTLSGLTAALFTAYQTATGIQGLHTQIDSLVAYSTENIGADIFITQTGDITIDLVSMAAGNFSLLSNGNITVDSLVTDQTGSLVVLTTTAGAIQQYVPTYTTPPATSLTTPPTTPPPPPAQNIFADALTLSATNGILLNTNVLVLQATNSGGTDTNRANIVLNNLALGELDISQIAASHGNIDLTTAGNVALKNPNVGQSVYLSTPTNGASSSIPYHITVTSAGKILGGTLGGGNPLFDIATDDLTLTAGTSILGIGNNNTLLTEVSKLTALTTGAGLIQIANHGGLELANVETYDGLIFVQNDSDITVDPHIVVTPPTVLHTGVVTDTVSAVNTITLISTAGFIDKNASTLATQANIVGDQLFLHAFTGILLNTNISVLTATDNGGTDAVRANISLNNLSSTELDVSQVTASHGSIDLTTAGDFVLTNLTPGITTFLSTPTNSVTPYHVNVTSLNGKILGGTTGDGSGATPHFDIVTDNVILTSVNSIDGLGVNNTLVTEISKLTATASGTGDISVTNRGALELVDIDTDNGLIFIQNDAAMKVDLVKSDTSIPANTIVLQNTLVSTSSDITLGIIDAGLSADVTVTSTGAILGSAGNLITGKTMTLTARGFEGLTNPAIDVNVLGTTLIANATGSGQIIIHTAGDLTLDQVDTASGDIHVTATGLASLLTSEVQAGYLAGFASDIYLTAGGTIGEYKPTPTNPARTYKIIGNLLTTNAGGTTYLDTIVQTLDSTITGTGTLTVDQTGDLNVYNANTNNGVVTITSIPAAGHTAANMFIGTLTAGSGVTGGSDVNLTTATGYIQDLDVTTITDPAVVPANPFLPLLSGATFTATTGEGIHGLHTAVTTFDATTTATTAYILMTEKDDILVDHVGMPFGNFTLTAGGTITVNDLTANTSSSTVNLISTGSRIQMETSQITAKINANVLNATADSGIQAWTNINDLTGTITGVAGDINVRNDGNLTLEHVFTPSGTFTLNLIVGSLTPSLLSNPLGTPPVYHVYANDIIINTTAGIGTAPDFLNVYADEVDRATASVSGGIYIHNFKTVHSGTYPNGFELHQVLANNGPIDITSAGDTYARDVEIHQDASGNDLTFTTTNGGNLLLNFVGTGLIDAVPGTTAPNYGIANFTSDGNIAAVDSSIMLQAVNIVANGINFNAQTGIGSGDNGPLITGKFLSAHTVIGDIVSGNSTASDFYISDYTTQFGNLNFTQKGGGALHATGFDTRHGNIKLTVGNGAYLFLGTTHGYGNTTLISDHINFEGGPASIFGTGALIIYPFDSSHYVELNSYFASTIYETFDTLEISKVSFAAFFTAFQTILIGNQSSSAMTYMFFDVSAMDGPYMGLSSNDYEMSSPKPGTGSGYDVDFFRVTDLYLTPTELAVLEKADADEISQILAAEMNMESGGGSDLLFDELGGDDFFAATTPAPSEAKYALHAAHDQHHGQVVNLQDDSSTENDAWIDRALVTTAVVAPMALTMKPKSWLDRLAQRFSRGNK